MQVAPSLSGGTATCSMATGVVTTQQGVLALLTTVTMRATNKSENTSEEFLSLEPIAIHLSTILSIYLSLYPLVHVSTISHQAR